jgi:hypothetical protein
VGRLDAGCLAAVARAGADAVDTIATPMEDSQAGRGCFGHGGLWGWGSTPTIPSPTVALASSRSSTTATVCAGASVGHGGGSSLPSPLPRLTRWRPLMFQSLLGPGWWS